MSFEWPSALLGLCVIPLLVALYLWGEHRRSAIAARFGNPTLLPDLVEGSPGRRRHVPAAVLLVVLATMIVGLARPHATVSVGREQATVVLAVDVSRSMRARDVKPSRLDAARTAAEAFLARVPKKFRVAVVSFATRAVVALPPSEDHSLAEEALASLRPGEGTSLGDAISLATRLTQRVHRGYGSVPPAAVLLISDGAQMGGNISPLAAARRAKALKVHVYAIAVGTATGTIALPLRRGLRQFVRVPATPGTLKLVARTTGGEFFSASTDTRLRDVYERLGSRLGSAQESREITDVFAGAAAVLLLVGGAVSALWFRRMV